MAWRRRPEGRGGVTGDRLERVDEKWSDDGTHALPGRRAGVSNQDPPLLPLSQLSNTTVRCREVFLHTSCTMIVYMHLTARRKGLSTMLILLYTHRGRDILARPSGRTTSLTLRGEYEATSL